jgi:hypothetical protein
MGVTRSAIPTSRAKKKPTKRLSNDQLLKLAAKRRPPQSWYDEKDDPTQPAPKGSRGR